MRCALKKMEACAKCFLFARAHAISLSFVRSNIRRLAQLALERASQSKAQRARAAAWQGLALLAILRSDAIIVWLRAWCACGRQLVKNRPLRLFAG
jgi:hypothetical protein